MPDGAFEILLVEDDPEDVRTRRLLAARGAHRVVHVIRLGDALDALKRRAFDVILLDLSLPGAEEAVAVSEVHQVAPGTPILLLGSERDEEKCVRAMKAGAQDYLIKGHFDGQVLDRAMRYAIERKRAEESSRRLTEERAARREAESAARRASFLAEAGRILGSPLQIELTMEKLAAFSVPFLADACLFDLLEDGGDIVRVAGAHGVAEKAGAIEALLHHAPNPARPQHPVVRAMQTKELVTVRVDDPASMSELADEERALFRALHPSGMIVIPMLARGIVMGTLTCLMTEEGRRLAGGDIALGQELSVRAAYAVEVARLYRAREDTLAIVSHDLRNPLNVITVATGTLAQRVVPDAKRSLYIEKIGRAAERMNRLIQDLLDATRIEAGAVEFELASLPVAPLLADAVERMKPLADDKSITLSEEVTEGLPDLVADRERLLQMFSNLLGNAIKFTPKGGTVVLAAERGDDRVRFRVTDTGPGIPDAHLTKIFDRFWQARRSDRSGAGLGLAIAKGIVRAHGGEIWAESPAGGGASFVVTVPAP